MASSDALIADAQTILQDLVDAPAPDLDDAVDVSLLDSTIFGNGSSILSASFQSTGNLFTRVRVYDARLRRYIEVHRKFAKAPYPTYQDELERIDDERVEIRCGLEHVWRDFLASKDSFVDFNGTLNTVSRKLNRYVGIINRAALLTPDS